MHGQPRDTEVLQFRMPSEPTQRFAPMINIQLDHVEQFVDEALRGVPELAQVRWNSRLTAVRPGAGLVEVDVQGPHGDLHRADDVLPLIANVQAQCAAEAGQG